MQSVAVIEKITDPKKRAERAARLINDAEAKAETARVARDKAAIALYSEYGYRPVQVYRDTIGVARSLFVRLTTDHEAGKAENPTEPVEAVVKRAKVNAKTVRQMNERIGQARTIRDDAIHELLTGNGAMSNADVARLTGLTTARVAQLRHGTR